MSMFMVLFWLACVLIVFFSIRSIRRNPKQQADLQRSLNQEIGEMTAKADTSRHYG
ncbi:hypothetical protein [Ectobacillus ponti]|uniref:Uncharacterized protein n=1 Tax=Ectobacillus ponti TaxID=2961894 RepID=A0AA42BN15_9BACI|nr:hypothetical protein [Ectobacillus ponti]MCP8967001.1 hypothetical protein [Ectobacillus ponti]